MFPMSLEQLAVTYFPPRPTPPPHLFVYLNSCFAGCRTSPHIHPYVPKYSNRISMGGEGAEWRGRGGGCRSAPALMAPNVEPLESLNNNVGFYLREVLTLSLGNNSESNPYIHYLF
jgi:hypothetical protein